MAGSLSASQAAALNRDARQFGFEFPGGLAEYLGDLEDTIDASPISAASSGTQIDAVCAGGGHFERDPDTTSGNTLGYKAARLYNGLALVDVAAGTVVLTPSSTNYVEVTAAGSVSANTVGFTSGRLPLWVVTTGVSAIATVVAKAPLRQVLGVGGVSGVLLSSPGRTKEIVVPLGTLSATTSIIVPTPGVAGVIVKAALAVGTTVAANDTDYWTFGVQNRGAAGTGTTAVLAATDANTTKLTGGSALTAYVARPLQLSGTGGNLVTAADDVLLLTATKAAAAANLVNATLRLDVTFS